MIARKLLLNLNAYAVSLAKNVCTKMVKFCQNNKLVLNPQMSNIIQLKKFNNKINYSVILLNNTSRLNISWSN